MNDLSHSVSHYSIYVPFQCDQQIPACRFITGVIYLSILQISSYGTSESPGNKTLLREAILKWIILERAQRESRKFNP